MNAKSNITRILTAIEQGDPHASDQLLPLVYEDLRRLAAQRLAQEKAGQTLQGTALVHEAYLRLVEAEKPQSWDGRGHFYAAAAEAMRRILVEQARRKQALKHGGGMARQDANEIQIAAPADQEDVLALDAALEKLTAADATKAELVKLRYFAGLTLEEAAECLHISPATADRYWAYAKVWLLREITSEGTSKPPQGKSHNS